MTRRPRTETDAQWTEIIETLRAAKIEPLPGMLLCIDTCDHEGAPVVIADVGRLTTGPDGTLWIMRPAGHHQGKFKPLADMLRDWRREVPVPDPDDDATYLLLIVELAIRLGVPPELAQQGVWIERGGYPTVRFTGSASGAARAAAAAAAEPHTTVWRLYSRGGVKTCYDTADVPRLLFLARALAKNMPKPRSVDADGFEEA